VLGLTADDHCDIVGIVAVPAGVFDDDPLALHVGADIDRRFDLIASIEVREQKNADDDRENDKDGSQEDDTDCLRLSTTVRSHMVFERLYRR